VDKTVAAFNINREVAELSEGLFSNNNIVDEILSDSALVYQVLSSKSGKSSRTDLSSGDLSKNDVKLAYCGIEGTEHLFVTCDGRVNRGEEGERTSSGEFGGDTGGFEAFHELSEVIVSLKVTFFLSDGDTFGSPDLSRSLEGSKGSENSASSSRSGSSRGCGSRCSSSRSGSSRGCSSSGGGTTCITHLQVFLEGRGGTNTLARILVCEGIGITGIGHTSGTKFWPIEHSSGERLLLGRGEGGSTCNKGSGKEDLGLLITEEKNTARTC
jgi:hypothetical protein